MVKTFKKVKDDNHAFEQAIAQLRSIKEMVIALEAAGDNDNKREAAEQTIQEDPLSIQVRSDWYTPGEQEGNKQNEFNILLCTGGPAVRVIGKLNQYGEPESVCLQYQDWFTPWENYQLTAENEEIVLTYCRQFYFCE